MFFILSNFRCLGIGSCLYGFDDVDDPTFDPLIADERPTKATTIEDDEEELHKQDQAINVSIHLVSFYIQIANSSECLSIYPVR